MRKENADKKIEREQDKTLFLIRGALVGQTTKEAIEETSMKGCDNLNIAPHLGKEELIGQPLNQGLKRINADMKTGT